MAPPVAEKRPTPVPAAPVPQQELGLKQSGARRPPVIVSSSPPSRGMPKWVVPLVLVVILGIVAAVLLTR